MLDIEAIAALQDPVRRKLYDHVAAQDHEVSRNEAAEAVGVQRGLAAFHLDKLVEVGLLEVTSRRLTGRSGPGAGRPAKLYRRSGAEHELSVPPRDYRTAAVLLAEAAEAAGLDRGLRDVARAHGEAAGRKAAVDAAAADDHDAAGTDTAGTDTAGTDAGPGLDRVAEVLAARGYEPRLDPAAVLRMRNCPFHALARDFPPLVCGMNLALLEGMLAGLGADDLAVRMDPRPGWCCTAISKNNEP